MRTKGNDIYVLRGETFSIDRSIKNGDGTPYRIDKRMVPEGKAAYFLLTVASEKYESDNRYLRNWWLPITDFVELPEYIEEWDVKKQDRPAMASDKLYFVTEVDGRQFYAKYDGDEFIEYSMRFVKHFSSEDTLEWTSRNYFYSVTLVTGQTTRDFLQSLYSEIGEVAPEYLTITQMRDYLSNKFHTVGNYEREEFVKNLDINRPLIEFDISRPIIPPSGLTVMSNMRGSSKF